jgi:catechol 2,3-dioxygenase-like lactoylglutathione lyase family enzyme
MGGATCEEMKMRLLSSSLSSLAVLLLGVAALHPAAAEEAAIESAGPLMWQKSMNVFRRFEVAPEEMFKFYGGALGLEQLQTFDVGGGTNVARFKAGNSEVKMTRRVPDRTYVPGAVDEATGLRLLTFFYPDEQAVVERFVENGYPAPEFEKIPGTNRLSAVVSDPDGHAVEIVIAPNAPAELYDTIEVGLTVSDLDESREFYREFVGLEELPPEDDPRFGTKKYPYRNGTTIVSLRSFGRDLPADTGTGGIQYVVTDVEAIDALAKERGVTIDQPLSELRGFSLRTIWLDDPDGITNYFAQTGASRRAAAQQ